VLRRCTCATAYRQNIISEASMVVQDGSMRKKGDQAAAIRQSQLDIPVAEYKQIASSS